VSPATIAQDGHWQLRKDVPALQEKGAGFLPTQWLEAALETPHHNLIWFGEQDEALVNARAAALKGQGASIELRLGDEYYVSTLDTPRRLSDREATLVIPGGQFALLTTHESVHIPTDCLALISMKSKVKLKGLVNISGFHIDPGFNGNIHYAVFNAGPSDIIVGRRQPLFQLFLTLLVDESDAPYSGEAQGGLSVDLVSQTRGRSVSLDSLASTVARLDAELKVAAALGVAMIVALVAILLSR
jgi:dCTP deaminase